MARIPAFLVMTLAAFFLSLSALLAASPAAEKGVVNLRDADLVNGPPVELKGEYRFFWKRFMTFDELAGEAWDRGEIFRGPRQWNWDDGKSKLYPAAGHGTFALKLLLPEGVGLLALRVGSVPSAVEIFVNGRPVLRSGKPCDGRDCERTHLKPDYVVIRNLLPETVLHMHVSNYHMEHGGFWEAVTLGPEKAVRRAWFIQEAGVILLFGSFMIMAVYHLAIFMLRRFDRAPLWFALFCTLIALRTVCMDQRLIAHLIEGFNWRLLRHIEFAGMYLGLPAFLMFLKSVLGKLVDDRVLKGALIFSGVIFLLELVRVPFVYVYLLKVFQPFLLAVCLYVLYVLGRALMAKVEGVRIFIAGLLFLFAAIVNDVLHSMMVISTAHVTPFGLIIFIFSQSFLLSRRFSTAFATAEKLSIELGEEKKVLESLIERIRFSVRELTEFAKTVRGTADALHGRMTSQGATLEETSAAAEEVSASIESISNKTSEQDAIVRETVPVFREYIDGLDRITQASRRAEELSATSLKRTEESARKLNDIIEGMEAIRRSSTQIGEITTVINDIAEKTNLLSLNASIEAARAGAAGRGFAVVAEEIGKLADSSIQQAKSIQEHIQSAVTSIEAELAIVADSEETIRGIGAGAGEALESVRSIGGLCAAQKDMADGLLQGTRDIAERSAEIARSTSEQMVTVGEVSKAIESLNHIMNDVLQSVAVLMDSLMVLDSQTKGLSSMVEEGTAGV